MTEYQIDLFGATVVGAAGATTGSLISGSPLGAVLFTITMVIVGGAIVFWHIIAGRFQE